jgi:hypothetical protein
MLSELRCGLLLYIYIIVLRYATRRLVEINIPTTRNLKIRSPSELHTTTRNAPLFAIL